MYIKRVGMVLSTMLIILLAGCAKETDARKIMHDGANTNAIVLSIDADRGEIVVKDSDDEGIFGEGCTLDCTGAPVVYCDYATGEVREISLADLSEGDSLIVEISISEIQNAKTGRAKIKQIQLNTQRLEK